MRLAVTYSFSVYWINEKKRHIRCRARGIDKDYESLTVTTDGQLKVFFPGGGTILTRPIIFSL